jgi:hypothetical protein
VAEILHPRAEKPVGAITVNCCDAWFTGLSPAHCTVCHATFTSVAGFDKHRTGSYEPHRRRCLDPATMTHGPASKRSGEPVFVDAGRKYPCWRFSGDDNRWSDR